MKYNNRLTTEQMREYQRQRRNKQRGLISQTLDYKDVIEPIYEQLLKKNPVAYSRWKAMQDG